jgi:hypothetical protein
LEADASGAARWSRIGRTVEPRTDWVSACEPRYERFLALTHHAP